MAVEFTLLGDVTARCGGQPLDLGHARQRCVLAVLLVEAGHSVSADTLTERVWAGPTRERRAALYSYLSRLRTVLADGGSRIERGRSGYRLAVDRDALDLHRFHHLVGQARAAAGPGALDLFEQALALWTGPALTGLDTPWLNGVRETLHQQQRAAELDRNDVALGCGQHARLLPRLTAAADAHPLDERIAAQLMHALSRSGRPADALAHYRLIRRRLADELGSDPGAALARVHRQLLRGDREQPAPAPAPRRIPAQLPLDVNGFSGRQDLLHRLDRLRAEADAHPTAMYVATLSGNAGVGKTTLAVHWAHRVLAHFPDGQLYANLRGYDPTHSPTPAGEAVQRFLEALDVPAARIPADHDAQVSLYRSLLAERRVLVVLDNARDADQVRPLLPGSPTCMAIVTSRDELPGLIVSEGAYPLRVAPLTAADAELLLAARLGPGRLRADQAGVQEIVARCGGLPLALAIVAARAATHPDFDLSVFAAQLRDDGPGLTGWSADDTAVDIRSVFWLSYHRLSPAAARLFRLLGRRPWHDLTAPAAANLADLPLGRIRPLLAELAQASMISQHKPGRYTIHDLMRRYAAELAAAEDTAADGAAADRRLLDYHRYTATRADSQLTRHVRPTAATVPPAPVTVPEPTGHEQAVAWLRAERANLLAALAHAADTGDDARYVGIAAGLAYLLHSDGPWDQAVDVHTAAVAAATRLGDGVAQAAALLDLAVIRYLTGDYATATALLERALRQCLTGGDRLGEANVRSYLGMVRQLTGDFPEAAQAAADALRIYRDLRDSLGEAGAYTNQGVVQYLVDDYAAADRSLTEALGRYRVLGHRLGEAHALLNLGNVRQLSGDYPGAAQVLEQALGRYRELSSLLGEANALTYLAELHRMTGEHDAAVHAARQALSVFRELGNRLGTANVLTCLGDVHRQAGDPNAALTALREALGIYRDMGDRYGEATSLACLGRAWSGLGTFAEAQPALDQALATFQDLGDRLGEAEVRNSLGELHRAAGRPRQGREQHELALRPAAEVDSRVERARGQEGAGRCALDLGDAGAAREHLRAALALYAELGSRDASRIAAELAQLAPA
ncbi:tetratricopeptide repeat protein [Catellatospora sp. TT07R-123]|uniref:AfsR/SARP family transcriptional regulator n=1 Tax=Catellatospora sp. TT07R-123 TaxID=2733863 RepID=UPI001BB45D41|nr:tetratricopeptide repeat protein [Catellatospora sp. TT07R-123]